MGKYGKYGEIDDETIQNNDSDGARHSINSVFMVLTCQLTLVQHISQSHELRQAALSNALPVGDPWLQGFKVSVHTLW